MNQNKKVMFVINPEIMRLAKAVYKGGKFYAASNSAFMRDVLETIYNNRILVSYLTIDFKPKVVDEYLEHLEKLFKLSTREPSRVCWYALTDRSFNSDEYILKDDLK